MDYSLRDPRVLDLSSRAAQAAKALRVLEHFSRSAGFSLAGASCLDVGCSSGIITRAVAPRFRCVVGVDVDAHALSLANPADVDSSTPSLAIPADVGTRVRALSEFVVVDVPSRLRAQSANADVPARSSAPSTVVDVHAGSRTQPWKGDAPVASPAQVLDANAIGSAVAAGVPVVTASFAAASGLALPFAEATFDLALCNQVYQYVPDVPRLLAEIHRVLRPGGVCYFTARNLWGIASAENRLPFLASLSPRAAAFVSRGSAAWQHRAGTLWPYHRLRALAAQSFAVFDYTTRVLSEPTLAALFVPARYRAALSLAPASFVRLAAPLLPTHIWVLQKRA